MIREMKKEDIDVLVELEKELFPTSPWPREQFAYDLFENPFSKIFVYEAKEGIIGYCDLWVMFDQAQIANIGVAKSAWGKGIATKLMNHCEALAKTTEECGFMTLEVAVSNARAISFYEKCNFIIVSVRKHYYDNGEDAYLMAKAILSEDKSSGTYFGN